MLSYKKFSQPAISARPAKSQPDPTRPARVLGQPDPTRPALFSARPDPTRKKASPRHHYSFAGCRSAAVAAGRAPVMGFFCFFFAVVDTLGMVSLSSWTRPRELAFSQGLKQRLKLFFLFLVRPCPPGRSGGGKGLREGPAGCCSRNSSSGLEQVIMASALLISTRPAQLNGN